MEFIVIDLKIVYACTLTTMTLLDIKLYVMLVHKNP